MINNHAIYGIHSGRLEEDLRFLKRLKSELHSLLCLPFFKTKNGLRFLLLLVILIFPAVSTATPYQEQLEALRTKDPILTAASQWVRTVIPTLLPERSNMQIDFVVLEYESKQITKIDSLLYTDGVKVLTRILPHPVILCNAQLLYEIEAVLRLFERSDSYFTSDEALFNLVREVSHDPKPYLMTLRTSAPDASKHEDPTEHFTLHMKLVMLYFVSHELGHILQGEDNKQFISMFSPERPLETRVVEAVVRMCRHAEEFDNYGFGLPLWDFVVDRESDIRKVEQAFREGELVRIAYNNANTWYRDEVIADSVANEFMLDYLSQLDRSSPAAVKEEQNIIIGNLFHMAVYYWYKDLYNFTRKVCPQSFQNSNSLMGCMMENREKYIKVASLFGDIHRFLLLRSYLAIERFLVERTEFFLLEHEQRTIWPDREELIQMSDQEALEKIWYYASLQQYYFLAILMDTAVKFSYVGCATGWFKEIDQQRGWPNLLVLTFEPINMVVQRLMQFP